MGGTPDEAVDDVIHGKADVFSTASRKRPFPGPAYCDRDQPREPGAHEPAAGVIFLFLNTRLAPFDRLDVRRGAELRRGSGRGVNAVGGPDVAQATCQILPPYSPGYRPYCPYTAGTTTQGTWTAPDLAKARALVARSGTRGMKITVWSWADRRASARTR